MFGRLIEYINSTEFGRKFLKGTSGSLHVQEQGVRPGESTTYDLVRTLESWEYIIVNATAQVASGPGIFGGMRSSSGTMTMSVYDGTSTAGLLMRSFTVLPGTDYIHSPPERFQIGLYAALTSGSGTARAQVEV